MNWDAISAVGEVVAAVAVIGSLLFVGNQLRLGQRIERAAGQRDILKQARDWMTCTQTDPELFRAVSSVMASSFDDANADDKHLFFTWMFDYFLVFEQGYYMHRDGFLNDASFHGLEAVALGIADTPGGSECWVHIQAIWGLDARTHLLARQEQLQNSVVSLYQFFPYFKDKALANGNSDEKYS